MSVLKVMFTGIITAMLLIYWTVGFGWMDFERLWVNPTYPGSGIVGSAWLALFAPASSHGALLAGALGGRHPASFPDIEAAQLPKFEPKVKLGAAGGKKASGGCGG